MRSQDQERRQVGRRTAVRAVGGAALGGAALGALGAGRTAQAESDHPPIVGTWILSATAQARTSFAGMMYIFHGGIVQYTDAPQRATHRTDDAAEVLEYQTIDGGQWIQTGFNEFAITTTGVDYDPRGNAFAMDVTTGRITYDPIRDTWSGAFTLTESDMSGTVRRTFSYTPTARRVSVSA